MDSYTTRVDVLLRDMQTMHYELVGCTDMNCHNINHIERIDKYYNDICNCLTTASSDTIGNRSNNNHNKPGWSEHVAELHDIARECLRYWRVYGCPKHGIIFDDMKTSSEIERCIAKLKNGKSNGMDNVSSEHLKYSSPRLACMLALCFTKMFSHGYLPTHMLSVQLVPIIKSKSGLISSKDNYRPIAIASVLSKVLEMIILERVELFVYTHENQFGFKKQHGTDTCIYVMKEIINRYQRLGSSVYLCFLDASKAFDRINHDTLFKKLVNRNVPAYIVRLLVFWYSHQQMFVKWGNVTSSVFTVSNGVRQGGVLSLYLFNVYMDGLSTTLNTCQTGCYSGVR